MQNIPQKHGSRSIDSPYRKFSDRMYARPSGDETHTNDLASARQHGACRDTILEGNKSHVCSVDGTEVGAETYRDSM
jgi:hypothetical protein